MAESLFLWYIPKVVNEPTDFKIVKVLKKYMDLTNGRDNIISSPGYMSRKSSTIKSFCDEFSKIVPTEKTNYIGYLRGYNTGAVIRTKPTSVKVIDEHYNYIKSKSKF